MARSVRIKHAFRTDASLLWTRTGNLHRYMPTEQAFRTDDSSAEG